MATLMKELMDAFYDLQREALSQEKLEAAQAYSLAEDRANSCHQLSAQEIRERLVDNFTTYREQACTGEEVEAWTSCLEVVEVYCSAALGE